MLNIKYQNLYEDLISNKAKSTIIEYSSKKNIYKYVPYSHYAESNAINDLYDLIIDNMVFYAFSEKEIVNLHSSIHILDDLRSAAKYAFAQRLPKRKNANSDGTIGEVLLDLLIQVYEPCTQKLIARAKHTEMNKKTEITGYDALYFTKSKDEICLWLGQAKAGSESYCKSDIKKDLNTKFSADYFADTAFYIADKSDSDDLTKLLNEINNICFVAQQCKMSGKDKVKQLIKLLQKNNVKIKIPCLMAYSMDIYQDSVSLKEKIERNTDSIVSYCDSEVFSINIGLCYDVIFYIFPIADVSYIRNKIVELKKEVE